MSSIVSNLCEMGTMNKELALNFIRTRSEYLWECLYHGGCGQSEMWEEVERLQSIAASPWDEEDMLVLEHCIEFYFGTRQNGVYMSD